MAPKKLSQISSGSAFNAATDLLLGVRSGSSDFLLSLPDFQSMMNTALANYATTTSLSTLSASMPTELSQLINDVGFVNAAGATADALAAILTGLSVSTNSPITAGDSVLTALGKLQAQVTSALNGLNTAITTITPSLVGTGATGTQVSAAKRSTIRLGLSESVTSTIGGAAIAAVNIKICATNNATEASWTNLFTFEEDQTVTLAIALQSIQVMKGVVAFDIPAGWYWKAESSGSGTNSESILTGQQIIYG